MNFKNISIDFVNSLFKTENCSIKNHPTYIEISNFNSTDIDKLIKVFPYLDPLRDDKLLLKQFLYNLKLK